MCKRSTGRRNHRCGQHSVKAKKESFPRGWMGTRRTAVESWIWWISPAPSAAWSRPPPCSCTPSTPSLWLLLSSVKHHSAMIFCSTLFNIQLWNILCSSQISGLRKNGLVWTIIFDKKTYWGQSLKFNSGSPQTGLGIFNVVTFPNEPCTSASGLNGTCLTTDECSVGKFFLELERTSLEGFDKCCDWFWSLMPAYKSVADLYV